MALFVKRPIKVEAITFNELVEYGKGTGADTVKGMPWSFQYKNYSITHENNECYIIQTLEGNMNMTPEDMLITGVQGEIYPCKLDIFEETYTPSVEKQ